MENEIVGIGSRVQHPQFGKGIVVQVRSDSYEIGFVEQGVRIIMKDYDQLKVIEAVPPREDLVSIEQVEKRLIRILKEYNSIKEEVPFGNKWTGGRIILEPGSSDLKSKEIPISAFFHKIVMVRDRLRVMEQRINTSGLSDEEKLNLQQYITRIYGSLTTFNVLFQNKEDYFIGERN